MTIELSSTYRRRFGADATFRQKMYEVLCREFFQKYVPKDAAVLDVAAGYCEFINNIEANEKIALDLNPDVEKFAKDDVKVIVSNSTNMKALKDNSIDVAFTSNLFEHLKREDIVKTMDEVYRVLKPEGRFLILQPNIRYCHKDYWMFFDHVTPIDDRGLCEALEVRGFEIVQSKPKFLPYTTKGRLPKSIALLRMYMRLPLAHRIFGKQAFIVAKKKGDDK
jgi:ubiquinone/menaquinone biosynthesis C-methylase UbiE